MNDVIYSGITVGTVLAYLGGGVGVSIAAELIKKGFKLNSSKVIHFVVLALSVAGAVLADAISVIHGNASVLAGHATSLLGLAELAHTFVVKNASDFVDKVQTALNDESSNTQPPSTLGSTTTIVNMNTQPAASTPATPPEASF